MTVISLGDSFHDRSARPRMAQDDVLLVRSLTEGGGLSLDRGQPRSQPPEDLGGRIGFGACAPLACVPVGLARARRARMIAAACIRGARWAGRGADAGCFASDGERAGDAGLARLGGGLVSCSMGAFRKVFPGGVVAGVIGRGWGCYAAARNGPRCR